MKTLFEVLKENPNKFMDYKELSELAGVNITSISRQLQKITVFKEIKKINGRNPRNNAVTSLYAYIE